MREGQEDLKKGSRKDRLPGGYANSFFAKA